MNFKQKIWTLCLLSSSHPQFSTDQQAWTGNKLFANYTPEKKLKLHIHVPVCLFIWKSNEKTNALFVNSPHAGSGFQKMGDLEEL